MSSLSVVDIFYTWRKNVKFQQVFEDYKSYICIHYSKNATIVVDGYNSEKFEVKSDERYRQGRNKILKELKFTEGMLIPRNNEFFLFNIKNEARFVMFLITYLKKETNLKISQAIEEADTLIFHTALNVAEHSEEKFIVVDADVDLAAMIINLIPNHKHIAMWKPKILKTWDVIYEDEKSNKFQNILLFAHAFTGCGTVSSIFNKGKHNLLNLSD